MPRIAATGSYTKANDGFLFLKSRGGRSRTLLLAGTPAGATIEIKYLDDENPGVLRTLENGTLTVLPKSVEIGPLAKDLTIVVTGGSPDFNVCDGGTEGQLQST